jgi:hypothetical protein
MIIPSFNPVGYSLAASSTIAASVTSTLTELVEPLAVAEDSSPMSYGFSLSAASVTCAGTSPSGATAGAGWSGTVESSMLV